MINKIVGYSAFKSYAQQPYATSKQGKELERDNKIWEDTVRSVDHVKPLENYQNSKTVYHDSHLENTFPRHYHPDRVPKGGGKTLNFEATGSIKAYDREQAKRYGTAANFNNSDAGGDERKNKLLKTGTEHWGSIYKTQLNRDSLDGIDRTGGQLNKFGKSGQTGQGSGANGENGENGQNQTGASGFNRSCSVGGKSQQQTAEEAARAKSYKNKPYINNAKMGETDYRFNYGSKIGSSPMDLMNRVSVKQPIRDNPLKRGTNQLWTEIPNYQGFKPSELSFKQYQEKIEGRNAQQKGNIKLQTADNFLLHPPGYGGFRPHFQKEMPKLRENCLSTTGMTQ